MSIASIRTMKKQLKEGRITSAKERIREYLEHTDGMSSLDLAQTLKMNYSTFTARISELRDEGIIFYSGTSTFFDKTYSILKYEFSPDMREYRIQQVREEKYFTALNRLNRDFSDLMTEEMGLLIKNILD